MSIANPVPVRIAAKVMQTTEANVRGIAKQLLGCYEVNTDADIRLDGAEVVDIVKLIDAWPVDRSTQKLWLAAYRSSIRT